MADDGQVLILLGRVEGQPQPEALGQRDLLFDHFAGMDLAVVGVAVGLVVLHVLRQQVPAVGRGVDQHVVRLRRDRAVERRLQRLVARLAFLERQVVAEDDEALGALRDQLDDIAEVAQVILVDLHQPQPVLDEGIQAGLDQRRLAGAARAGQQHVVGRQPVHELARVGDDGILLALDVLQVVQVDRRQLAHRLQVADIAEQALALAPAERYRLLPVRVVQLRRQPLFEAGKEVVEAGGEV
ncbi:hypothetical protein D3C81_1281610 [compost metagenome]